MNIHRTVCIRDVTIGFSALFSGKYIVTPSYFGQGSRESGSVRCVLSMASI